MGSNNPRASQQTVAGCCGSQGFPEARATGPQMVPFLGLLEILPLRPRLLCSCSGHSPDVGGKAALWAYGLQRSCA